jgi:hypothetical protein
MDPTQIRILLALALLSCVLAAQVALQAGSPIALP